MSSRPIAGVAVTPCRMIDRTITSDTTAQTGPMSGKSAFTVA